MSDDKKYISFDDMMKDFDERMANRTRWQKIKDFIRCDIVDKVDTFYYDLKHFIKDIFIYIPMLWKNREYDYEYLISFMIFKLKRMERLHRFNGHLECSIEIADEIKGVIERLEALLTWEKNLTEDDIENYGQLLIEEKEEYEEVFKMIGTRIQHWWD